MSKSPGRVMSVIALLTAIGCGGGDDGQGPTGSISLTASPSALTVQQGGTGTVTVTLVRGGGFADPVNVSVTGLPSGVTLSVLPAQLTGQTTQAVVTVNVASTVPAGTYTATVSGTATGVGTATVTYTLTVTASPGPTANFAITAAPNALSVTPGGTGNSTITVARTNLTADIALTLASPPAGITGAFTPATLSGATLTSALVISVAANVAAGVYPVTVQGVGGSLTRTAVVTVTVGTASSVSLSLNPATLSIQQGSSGQSTLTATRTNYIGTITPSVTGNPAGMTVTFNPDPILGNTSTVTVSVGAAVAVGQYSLTITGAVGAAGNPTTTLQVSVTAPAGGNIVWEFCNSGDVPLRFWRLSGGTWAEVAPTVVGSVTRFSFTISSTSGGVAFTVSNTGGAARTSLRTSRQRSTLRTFTRQTRDKANGTRLRLTSRDIALTDPFFDTFVLFAQTSELADFQETCTTTPATVSKTFNISGLGASEAGLLGYGDASTSLVPQTTSVNLLVEAGSHDWMAIFGPAPTLPDQTYAWSAYRIGRNEPAPGGAVAVNRVGATAFTTFPFTVAGGNAGSFFLFSQNLEGARGQIIAFPIGSQLSSTNNGTMLFPQPADRLSTDLMSLALSNTELIGNNIDFRLSTRYLGSAPPASGNFTLNASVPTFTVTPVNGAPVPTWSATGQTPSDYQTAGSLLEVGFTGSGESTLYTIAATRAWLVANNFSTNYTLTGPTLPNFLAQWAPAGPLASSEVLMFGSNFTTAPVAGSIVNIAYRLQAP